MKLLRPILAAAGIALFGAGFALAAFDAFMALELDRFSPPDAPPPRFRAVPPIPRRHRRELLAPSAVAPSALPICGPDRRLRRAWPSPRIHGPWRTDDPGNRRRCRRPALPALGAGAAAGAAAGSGPLAERPEAFKRKVVLAELKRQGYHITNAARALGLERNHLYKKCQQLGIDIPALRRDDENR